MKSMAKKPKGERIKVSDLEIIVTMMDKDPYYEIKYKKIGENHYNVGYASYKIENVLAWRDECFEIMTSPQTNADRIRSMTDEELADFLVTVETYGYHDQSISGTYEMKEWLLMESEE
nr:MAG TPA: hypothetical protein [Caudoviricetes sp.]